MSLYRHRFCFAAMGVLLLLTLRPGWAQNTPPENAAPKGDAVSVRTDDEDPKLPIESVQPYASWKHHVADKPEEAVVPVQYSEAGSERKQLATGLVVRCDGFVLVPRNVRDIGRLGGTIQVTLSNVDGAETDGPVTVPARNNPFTHQTVPYALIKTNGKHVRCLPMLSSVNVSVKKLVRLFWYAPKQKGAPELLSRKLMIDAATAAQDTFSLAPVEEGGSEIPSGAIVVDDESSAAVGIVTQGGTHPAFITLSRFNVISCDIGLAPDRVAVRLGDRRGLLPSGMEEMVWVPGGAVALDGDTAREFTRDYNTNVVCTPGFWMAVQPVRNGDYRRWLLKENVRRLPYGWSSREVDAPVRREDFPACGMMPADAGFYASDHHSRLPTDTEWRRAAYTRDTAWVDEMTRQWEKDSQHLGDLYVQQGRAVDAMITELQNAVLQSSANKRSGLRNDAQIRVNFISTPEMDAAAEEILQFSESIVDRDFPWGQVMSVDACKQDISIFGVRNVLINAPELVLSRVQGAFNIAPKYYPALMDRYISGASYYAAWGGGFSISSNANTTNTMYRQAFSREAREYASETSRRVGVIFTAWGDTSLWRSGSSSLSMRIMSTSMLLTNAQHLQGDVTFRYSVSMSAKVKEGFRCAR